MIETFTKQDFEDYLNDHLPFEPLGLIDGEETYLLPLDNQVSVTVRSSVKSNGLSADTGKDSIRCWLVSGDKPLGSKISKWTTRQPGWQERLGKNIDQLTLWRALAGDCKECNQAKGIFKVKKEGPNKGRPFAKCREHNGFVWLDEPVKTGDIYFSEESHGKNSRSVQTSTDAKDEVSRTEEPSADVQMGSAPEQPDNKHDILLRIRDTGNEERQSDLQELSKNPNLQQKEAIESDINANLRVLAGPGSGKTFVIERRYKHLVDNGINPNKIIVCTFSKPMADEMGKRIQETCPEANLEQISTIHALCYRLLCKWDASSRYYGWRVPKEWQIKKALEEIIGTIWNGEKPSAQEVFNYINTSKTLGLTTDDSYLWFIEILGQEYGEWLYEIRSRFDAWLSRNRFITFADMLFLVEQRCKTDEAWRTGLQERFSHVVVDEAQDTNYQAMRILVTISLEPGKNTVYEVRKNNDYTN